MRWGKLCCSAAVYGLAMAALFGQKFDFETPLLKPEKYGNAFANPAGNFRYDDSGENARSGKGAMFLGQGGRLTFDYGAIKVGSRYRLSVYLKGSGEGVAEIRWIGDQHKVLHVERRGMKLSADYKRLNVVSTAPEGVKRAYLDFRPGGENSQVYLDDMSVEEFTPDAKPVLLDFEEALTKARGLGAHFVNPTGSFVYDDSGENAYRGIGAMKLSGNGRITIDYKNLSAETRYRLSAFMKGQGEGCLEIRWLGESNKALGGAQYAMKLSGEYKRLTLSGTAPTGVKHAYLMFYSKGENAEILVDDIDMEALVPEKNPALLDFEEPLTKAQSVGKHYVNPTGDFEYDNSGNNAYRGIGAMKLNGKGRVTVDFKGIEAGKTYQLSGYFKGDATALMQIQWRGGKESKLETKSFKLTGEYQLCKVTGKVPEGATGVYLHVFGNTEGKSFYLDDLRFEELASDPDAPSITATFAGEKERFSIYEPGEPVKIIVRGDEKIKADDVLEWKLCDYQNRELKQGKVDLTLQQFQEGYEFTPGEVADAGCYFLYMKLAKSGATIPYKGSRLPGYVTFGVLPKIEALKIGSAEESRFGGQGTNFIGSGKFMEGDSYRPFYPTVGMKWIYNGRSLNSLEPQPGAFKVLSPEEYRGKTVPYSASNQMVEIQDLHGIPQHLLNLPEYVKKNSKWSNVLAQSFPLKDTAGYTELVGRVARDLRNRKDVFFSHLKRNYYQLHWEPDWHWDGTEDEFIETYRAAREGIRANDPDAWLLGANYGVIGRGNRKMESMFQKGLGKYLDGILIHLYFLPVSMEPEAAGLHNDCRKIRQLADKYIRPGAPIINTEWGVDYRGDTRDLTHDLLMNHLYRFTRGHIIALGEGFDATWFFYTTDYCSYTSNGGEQGYGISFNTSSYIDKHKFGAASLEPKPTMMAAAAMTRLLEGTKTLGRLAHLDSNIFAYAFRRGDDNLIVVWCPQGERQLQLPVGVKAVTVYDIMGNPRQVQTPDETLSLTVGRFPQYIQGSADRVLPVADRNADSIFSATRAALPPGAELKSLLRGKIPAQLQLNRNAITKNVPENLAAGFYELAALDKNGQCLESMLLEVTGLCELGKIREGLDKNGKLKFDLPLRNLTKKQMDLVIRAEFDGEVFAEFPAKAGAESEVTLEIPGGKLAYDGLKQKILKVSALVNGGVQKSAERHFGMVIPKPLGRIEIDGNIDDWYPGFFTRYHGAEALTYQSKRHRGNADFSASYALGYSGNDLYLAVKVLDDVAMNTVNPQQPWREDSLIIALGRDSDNNGEFKINRKFSFTRDQDGTARIQEILGTPPKHTEQLSPEAIKCVINRNEGTRATVYELKIPLSLISENPRQDNIGFGITLHDVDTVDEVKNDQHREMSLLGGVPLFMGNAKLATLLIPPEANRAVSIWDAAELFKTPQYEPSPFADSEVPGIKAILYNGYPLADGRPSKVFAYYGVPETTRPANGFPAVLMVHGGGGTAFAKYLKMYVERGYAVLAMDLYGKRPLGLEDKKRESIPDGSADQWELRSIANIIQANSLLRSMPEVDKNNIGLVGISWGGVFGSVVSTLDTRLKFIAAVYGCGFWNAGDASSNFGKSRRSRWYDPGNFLAHAQVPIYWIIGADDQSFGVNSWAKTTMAAPSTVNRILLPKQSHSHVGFELKPTFRIVDAGLKNETPLPLLGPVTVLDRKISAPVLEKGKGIQKAVLFYCDDPAGTPQQKRQWKSVDARLNGNTVEAEIPDGARCWFLNAYDDENSGATAPLTKEFIVD